MAAVFKNEFQWTKGVDKVRRVLLRDGSSLERIYASCCGTPLGSTSAKMKSFPLIMLYRDLLTYTNGREFLPSKWRMFTSRVPTDQQLWKEDASHQNTIESETIPPSFLLSAIARILYGLFYGLGLPDPTDAIESKAEILNLVEAVSK